MECIQEEELSFSQIEQDDYCDYSLGEDINYYDEIFSIMHAFGDVKKPLHNSVRLMHRILEGQLTLLIKKAENTMKFRGAEKLSHEDLLFLMRKNKVLLKRLLYFLSVEDTRSYLLPGVKKLEDGLFPEKGERVSKCLKYLAFIEKFERNLTSIFKDKGVVDHVYIKRLKRRDLMTNSMSKEEYENFFEYTLRVSFCYKHANEKFVKFLKQCSWPELTITPLALSIIHFLARETIAGIVEKALDIKSRKYSKSDSFPFSNFGTSVDLFHVSEDSFNSDDSKINQLRKNLQSSFSKISENNSKRSENSDFEENSITQSSCIGLQEMRSCLNVLLDTDNAVSCSITTSTKEKSMISKNSVTCYSPTDIQNKNDSPKSHTSSKSNSNASESKDKISNDVLDANESVQHSARKRKKNCDICDNSALDCKSSDTCYVIADGTNSALNCEYRTNQAVSDAQDHVPVASKKITKEPYFSLNFHEKTFSVFCDGSNTFEIDMGPKRKRTRKEKKNEYIKAMENNGLTTACIVESVEQSKSVSSDFGKHAGHLPFVTPIKKDSKMHWLPKEGITPSEIQAAFIHYQRPLPMSCLMKTVLTFSSPKKTNLVCLANPDEFNLY